MDINLNGNSNDTNYRYTMPSVEVNIGGKGNGIYTIISNINEICTAINHPIEVILNYLASVTGSSCIIERNTLTGTHKSEDLNKYILEYVKYLVMCAECNIPETIPKMSGSKKNISINLCCSACNSEVKVKEVNKRIIKGNELIIKYLKAGKVWPTPKEKVGKASSSNAPVDINPFNIN